jgi:hypothetical protein
MTTDIESRISSWAGLKAGPHRLAGREFTIAGQAVGHVHGDRRAEIPFPKRVRDVVVAEGLSSKHHLFPESGWVTKYVRTTADLDRAVWLFRIAYLYKIAAPQRRVDVAADVAAELDELELPPGLREGFPPLSAGTTATAAG